MKKRTMLIILLIIAIVPMTVTAQPLDFEWYCDIIDNNPNSFLLDEQVWNSTSEDWDPPLWYQLYWNGTALEAPPLEYQMRSFNFTVSTSHNATKTMAVYTNSYPSPMSRFLGNETDHYVNHSYWWATNGVIHASSGPYKTMDNITGTVENFMWNQSDWYRLYISGHYYDSYYETHEGDPSVSYGNIYYFYLNVTDEVELIPPLSPTTELFESIKVMTQIVAEIIAIPFRILKNTVMAIMNTLIP